MWNNYAITIYIVSQPFEIFPSIFPAWTSKRHINEMVNTYHGSLRSSIVFVKINQYMWYWIYIQWAFGKFIAIIMCRLNHTTKTFAMGDGDELGRYFQAFTGSLYGDGNAMEKFILKDNMLGTGRGACNRGVSWALAPRIHLSLQATHATSNHTLLLWFGDTTTVVRTARQRE